MLILVNIKADLRTRIGGFERKAELICIGGREILHHWAAGRIEEHNTWAKRCRRHIWFCLGIFSTHCYSFKIDEEVEGDDEGDDDIPIISTLIDLDSVLDPGSDIVNPGVDDGYEEFIMIEEQRKLQQQLDEITKRLRGSRQGSQQPQQSTFQGSQDSQQPQANSLVISTCLRTDRCLITTVMVDLGDFKGDVHKSIGELSWAMKNVLGR